MNKNGSCKRAICFVLWKCTMHTPNAFHICKIVLLFFECLQPATFPICNLKFVFCLYCGGWKIDMQNKFQVCLCHIQDLDLDWRWKLSVSPQNAMLISWNNCDFRSGLNLQNPTSILSIIHSLSLQNFRRTELRLFYFLLFLLVLRRRRACIKSHNTVF